jgi:hypothetical protein
LRKVTVQQIDGFGGPGARRYGTLKKIGEEDATLLEVGQDFFVGLPSRGDRQSGQEITGEACERILGRVEKLGVSIRGRSSDQQGLDVDRAETGGPFEALQTASDMVSGGELAAAVARQECGDSHIQKW